MIKIHPGRLVKDRAPRRASRFLFCSPSPLFVLVHEIRRGEPMKLSIAVLLSSIAAILLGGVSGAFAMGLKDLGKVCLFSGMSGVIEMDGKPAANVRLVRTAESKVDETTTDENGYFEFPSVFERTIAKYLPQEFAASQKIVAHYQGREIDVWVGVKRKPEEHVESRGKPLVVHCELGLEVENLIQVNNSPIFSRCTWDVEPDPKRKVFQR